MLSRLDYCNPVLRGIPCGIPSRSYSVFRTVQHRSFSRRQGDHTPSHYYASCTGCRFNIESRTSWRYWNTRSGPHRRQATWQCAETLRSTTTTRCLNRSL